MKVYRQSQADLQYIRNEQILIIGYGSQGRSFALNLRDSGIRTVVCLKPGSGSRKIAGFDKMPVIAPGQIGSAYTLFFFLLPDHLHGIFFEKYIRRHLRENSCLVFAHGYSVYFRVLVAPPLTDVILVAPHGPGKHVREAFLQNSGLSCFVARHQDHSGQALKKALAIARGIGSTRIGAFETSFENETLGDIFGEQALLCGGLAELVSHTYEILVTNGIQPENAWLETAHQIELLAGLIDKYGIQGMMRRISRTAQYGMLNASGKIIDSSGHRRLEKLFRQIKSGKFAADWQQEFASGERNLRRYKRALKMAEIEKTTRKMRRILDK